MKVALSLGLLIYKALDYGMDKEEEPLLSTELEALIIFMTNNFGEGNSKASDCIQYCLNLIKIWQDLKMKWKTVYMKQMTKE